MKIWYDVTTTLNWNRPPVGIVRTEVELIRKALLHPNSAFFRVSTKGVYEVSNASVKQKISALTNNKPARIEANEKRTIQRRNSILSISELRSFLVQKIGTMSPRSRHMLMLFALPANALLDFILQFPGFVAGVSRHLRAQLQNERSQYVASLDSKKDDYSPVTNINFGKHKGCSDDCTWRIFSEGDVVFSAGLLWDYMNFSKFHAEKRTHKFIFANILYDLIPVKFPQFVPDKFPSKFLDYIGNLLWGSDHFFCISKTTEGDLLEFADLQGFPSNLSTSVVTLGDSVAEHSEPIKQISELNRPFILYVSTIERRKNHQLLLSVIEQLNYEENPHLPTFVFVGMSGWHVEELFRDIALNPKLQFPDGSHVVKILNNVSDENLRWLYKNALFSVFPSFYEGWGLPVAESLIHGTPVIASDRGSLLEASQGFAKHLNPYDAVSWTNEMLDLIQEPQRLAAAQVQAQNYVRRDWGTFADQVIAKLETLGKVGK